MSDKKKQSFNIGQVVYVLPDKAEAIVPAIVVEEMVIKKLDGETVSWKVAVGPPEKKKIVASHELSGEVYTSLDEIKSVMTKRLSEFIDNLVKQAENRTELWYGKQLEQKKVNADTDGVDNKDKKIDPTSLIDSIENENSVAPAAKETQQKGNDPALGSYKIKAPVNHGPLQTNSHLDPSNPKNSLREKLRQMADPGDEDAGDNSIQSDDYVLTPDGRQVPVRYKHNE